MYNSTELTSQYSDLILVPCLRHKKHFISQ